MVSKNVKEMKAKKIDELRRNDVKLYRLMVEFGLTVVAVLLAVAAGNANKIQLHFSVMPILLVVTGVLFAAWAAFYSLSRKKAGDNTYKVVTREGVFGNLTALFFGCLHFYLFEDAQALIIAIITASVLYFTYNIFDKPLLDFSVVTAVGFLLLKTSEISKVSLTTLANAVVFGAKGLALVLPVAAIIYAFVRYSKKRSRVSFVPIVVSSALTLAGALLTFLYPAAASFAVVGILICYLVTVVAYTIKNM